MVEFIKKLVRKPDYLQWVKERKSPFIFQPITLKLGHTALDGTRYYFHPDPLQMVVERRNRIQTYITQMSYGEDVKAHQDRLSKTIEAIIGGDSSEAITLLYECQELIKNAQPEACALRIAACLFIREWENPYHFEPDIFEEKIKHCERDPELRAFFLQNGLPYLSYAKNLSEERIQGYSQNKQANEEEQNPNENDFGNLNTAESSKDITMSALRSLGAMQ